MFIKDGGIWENALVQVKLTQHLQDELARITQIRYSIYLIWLMKLNNFSNEQMCIKTDENIKLQLKNEELEKENSRLLVIIKELKENKPFTS